MARVWRVSFPLNPITWFWNEEIADFVDVHLSLGFCELICCTNKIGSIIGENLTNRAFSGHKTSKRKYEGVGVHREYTFQMNSSWGKAFKENNNAFCLLPSILDLEWAKHVHSNITERSFCNKPFWGNIGHLLLSFFSSYASAGNISMYHTSNHWVG